MSKAKKALTDQLVVAITPLLNTPPEGTPPSKAVAKTLRKLAKHLLKQQGKTVKAAKAAPAAPTAKQARKALAGELTASLQAHLGPDDRAAGTAPKAVAKTIKRLAGDLTKQRRKQAKQAAKEVAVSPATPAAAQPAPATKQAPRPRAKATPPASRPAAQRPAPAPATTAPVAQETATT